MMKKRIGWIDTAKFTSIFFVMLSHFEKCPGYLRAFFAPFYLSVFFFCSGYCYKQSGDFSSFLKKKVKTLVLPWFIYSNLNIILSNIKSFKHHENSFVTEVFRNLLQIRYFDERLWFIPALFTAFTPFFFLIRYYSGKKDKKIILAICFVLCLARQLYKAFVDPNVFPWKLTSLPWHIDYIPTAMLFMTLGYFFKESWEKEFDDKADTKFRFLLLLVYLGFVYYDHFNGYTLPLMVDFFYDHIRHFLSILVVVSVSKAMPANPVILYIGSNTLVYFCIHNKAVTLVETIFKVFLPDLYENIAGPLRSTIFCFAMTAVVSLILLVPTYLINRYLPWTLGRNSRQKAAS